MKKKGYKHIIMNCVKTRGYESRDNKEEFELGQRMKSKGSLCMVVCKFLLFNYESEFSNV